MDCNNLARGIFPVTKRFQVKIPMDSTIVPVQHTHCTNLVVTIIVVPFNVKKSIALAMLKFGPEPGFKLQATELNLRFRSSLVLVLLADHTFDSSFQKANNFANPVWTSLNLKPIYMFLGINNKTWSHGSFNENHMSATSSIPVYKDWQLSIIISNDLPVCFMCWIWTLEGSGGGFCVSTIW